MLRDAAEGRMLAEAPWLLTPAIAIAITVLSVNLVANGRGRSLPHWDEGHKQLINSQLGQTSSD